VTQWWYYALGIGGLVVIMVGCLLPEICGMVQLRKERKLWGYDAKHFAKADLRKNEEDYPASRAGMGIRNSPLSRGFRSD
jgi:hypothetical protein